jgi:hypothetical protein
MRLNNSDSRDTSFPGTGAGRRAQVLLQSDNRIWLGGEFSATTV